MYDCIFGYSRPANMPVVVCDNAEKANKLLSLVEENSVKHLTTIVVMDATDDVNIALASKLNVDIVPFSDTQVCFSTHF